MRTLVANFSKILLTWGAIGRGELGIFCGRSGIEDKLDIAALGNLERGITGFGMIGKKSTHLLGGLKVDLGRVALAVLIDDEAANSDADEDIVRLVVFLIEKVDVVGRDHLHPESLGESIQHLAALLLRFKPVIVDFEVKILFPVDLAEFLRGLVSDVVLILKNPLIEWS